MLLLSTLSLVACASQPELYPPGPHGATPPPPSPPPGGAAGGPVALLLPLTGSNAGLAQGMLNAAKLALDVPGAPKLDVRDTGGTPTGAGSAAQQAIAAGDRVILGPLTAAETGAVAGPAQAAGVPVLAFTSDPAQARPGVWTLGLTPGQQARRLVGAARAKGKTRFAALVPDNEFGHVMAAALADATTAADAPPPAIRQYAENMSAINDAVRDISAYAERRGPIADKLKAARASTDAEGRDQAAELARQPVPPPPFDALLLAATGVHLAELASALPYYDVDPREVQIMGPALWAQPGARGSAGKFLEGTWYAAPDPAARTPFEAQYRAKFAASPPSLADLAYDAAAIARVANQQGGALLAVITRSEGFAGVDGLLALGPDGHVRRSLAVFEIRNGNPKVLEPPPPLGGAGV